jgi:hypothetical protein
MVFQLLERTRETLNSGQYRIWDSDAEQTEALKSLEAAVERESESGEEVREQQQALRREALIEMANNMTDVPGGYEPKMTGPTPPQPTYNPKGYTRRSDMQ